MARAKTLRRFHEVEFDELSGGRRKRKLVEREEELYRTRST